MNLGKYVIVYEIKYIVYKCKLWIRELVEGKGSIGFEKKIWFSGFFV